MTEVRVARIATWKLLPVGIVVNGKRITEAS